MNWPEPLMPRSTLNRLIQSLCAGASTVLLAGAASAASGSPADDGTRLSLGLEVVARALAAEDAAGPIALVIDRAELSVTDTSGLLDALENAERNGRAVVAICPKLAQPAAGGSALIALSCDAIAFVEGAWILGAADGWCDRPETLDRMKSACTRLGGIDPMLAGRLCSAGTRLSWSDEPGFSTSPPIAEAGAPIRIDAATLASIGLESRLYPDLQSAIDAAEGGEIELRGSNGADSQAGRNSAKAPAPKTPTTKPASTKPAATKPAASDLATRLAPKIAEYNQALAELQSLQKRFYLYWIGRDGVWTTQHQSLREIWRTESDHTAHADTRTTCQRLQRDMKAAITTLRTTASDIIRIAKDPANPAVVRVNSHKEPLEEFRDALQRNKVDLYEKWYPAIEKLK